VTFSSLGSYTELTAPYPPLLPRFGALFDEKYRMHDLLNVILELLKGLLVGLTPSREPYRTWFLLVSILLIGSCVGIAWLVQAR
jgi:hypothetical protein